MIIRLQWLWLVFARLGAASRSSRALRSDLGRRDQIWCIMVLVAALTLAGLLGLRLLSAARVGSKPVIQVKSTSPKVKVQLGRSGAEPSLTDLQAANKALELQLRRLAPSGLNLVIDTAGNRVILRRGENTEAEMVASCGSGNVLVDPRGGRSWTFDTPRGQFSIQSRLTKPVWMKPDWAFIEEGLEIPTDPAQRAEAGMMGEYALGLGQGYFIHGTLYTRMLGRNVSHGCVRLGDRDLERLYRDLPLGTRVMIF
ncbi:MAG: L,D-transpeptidase [Proteobacteria bacterium]|nr:L,D-transpeptidase [Pseudomonadota bacterium]MBU1737682.1 L,D-transpeptidase [Pseudomonadota bacterium]